MIYQGGRYRFGDLDRFEDFAHLFFRRKDRTRCKMHITTSLKHLGANTIRNFDITILYHEAKCNASKERVTTGTDCPHFVQILESARSGTVYGQPGRRETRLTFQKILSYEF